MKVSILFTKLSAFLFNLIMNSHKSSACPHYRGNDDYDYHDCDSDLMSLWYIFIFACQILAHQIFHGDLFTSVKTTQTWDDWAFVIRALVPRLTHSTLSPLSPVPLTRVSPSQLALSQPLASHSQMPEPPPVFLHPIPHPDEIICPAHGWYISGFYVVFCSRECGIYFNWYIDYTLCVLQYW